MYRIIVFILFSYGFCEIQAQTLEELWQMTVDNNPSLKALQLNYERVLLDKDKIQLSDPTLGIGVPILAPETRLGAQNLMVSYSQMFPWVGTLKAKKEVAISMSSVEYEKIAIKRLELYFNIENAYYNYHFLLKKEKIIKKYIKNYGVFENIALVKVENGLGILSDVLQIQSEKIHLEKELESLENKRFQWLSKIEELINQPLDSLSENNDLDSIPSFNYDAIQFEKEIEANHPVLNQLSLQQEVSKNVINANIRQGLPAIGIGVDYGLISPRTDANPQNNGRDVVIPKVQISVPLYRKKYKAIEEQENLYQEQLESEKEATINHFMQMLKSQKSDFDNAILAINTKNQQLSILTSAYQILLTNYSSSGSDFIDVLNLQNQLLKLELELYQSVTNSYLSRAKINQITNYMSYEK